MATATPDDQRRTNDIRPFRIKTVTLPHTRTVLLSCVKTFFTLLLLLTRGWNAVALDDLDIPSVSAAWRRFSRDEGKGRLGRVVQATAEHITHAQVGGVCVD